MSDPSDLPSDLDVPLEGLDWLDVSRGQAVQRLIRMVVDLRARNLALLDHVAGLTLRNSTGATVISVGTGPDALSILAWRDSADRIQTVAL